MLSSSCCMTEHLMLYQARQGVCCDVEKKLGLRSPHPYQAQAPMGGWSSRTCVPICRPYPRSSPATSDRSRSSHAIPANLGGLYSLHVSGCSGRITGRKASKQGTCTGSGQAKLFGDSLLRLQHSRISTQIFGTFWIQSIRPSDWDSLREHIHFSR